MTVGPEKILLGEIPVIKCLPRVLIYGYGMKFWCPYCKTWHLHGIGNGHRVEHCTAINSPFKEHGYFLKMMAKAELREIQKEITTYLNDPGCSFSVLDQNNKAICFKNEDSPTNCKPNCKERKQ